MIQKTVEKSIQTYHAGPRLMSKWWSQYNYAQEVFLTKTKGYKDNGHCAHRVKISADTLVYFIKTLLKTTHMHMYTS